MHASHSKLGMERQRSIRQRYAGVALLLALLLKPTNPVAWNKGFGSAADRFVMASRMSSLICGTVQHARSSQRVLRGSPGHACASSLDSRLYGDRLPPRPLVRFVANDPWELRVQAPVPPRPHAEPRHQPRPPLLVDHRADLCLLTVRQLEAQVLGERVTAVGARPARLLGGRAELEERAASKTMPCEGKASL